MEHDEAQAAALERVADALDAVVLRVGSRAFVTHQDCTDLWADLLVLVAEVSRGGWGRALDGTGLPMAWSDDDESVAAAAAATQRRLLLSLHTQGRVYPPDALPDDDADVIDLIATVLLSVGADVRTWADGAYDQYRTDLSGLLAVVGSWLDAFEPTVGGIPAVRQPVLAD